MSALTIEGVRHTIRKWLHFAPEDVEMIDVTLACVYSIRVPGERLWLLLVDVPGSGKTELIRSFRGMPETHFLSTLTPKTLISGFRPGGRDFSLLPKLHNKVLTIKDLTPIMDLPPDQQRQIFGTLRDAFDGFSDHARGTMDTASHDVSFGLLAGVTNVIDLPRRIAEQELGDRYLKVRFHCEDSEASSQKAWENSGRESEMRAEIAKVVQEFLQSLGVPHSFPKPPFDEVLRMASLTAKLRAPVKRDHHHRIVALPRPERPTRLLKQLTSLLTSLALVRGHTCVKREDLDTAWRVALDTAIPMRLKVYEAVRDAGRPVTAAELSNRTRIPLWTLKIVAEDLWALKLLERQESLGEDDCRYQLAGDQE